MWIAAYTDPAPPPVARPLVWFRDDSDRTVLHMLPDLAPDAGPVWCRRLSPSTLFLVAGMTGVPADKITYAELATEPHARGLHDPR